MSSRPASRPRSGSSSARRLPTPAAPTHGPPPARRLARWTTVRTTRASPPTWGTFTRPATRPRPRAMVVAAVKRASRDAGTAAPIGSLTRPALEGVSANGRCRRTEPPRPGPRPHCRRVRHRPRHLPPAAPHRPRPRAARRPPSAAAWSTVRSSPCCSTAPSVAARSPACTGPTSTSATATTSWSPSAARRPTRPGDVLMCDVWSAAARPQSAACTPRSLRNRGIWSSASASTRSTAGSPPPAQPPASRGRRTSHGGRVGLAVELTARGASTHAIQIAGGWKGPAMVVRYAASISTREGAVSKYLR